MQLNESIIYQELKGVIDNRFHDFLSDRPYKISYVKPETLLNINRLDIPVKVKYLETLVNKDSEYYKSLYRSHLKYFTHGSYIEPGAVAKSSFEDYVSGFLAIYESLKKKGFDHKLGVIPVSEGGVILDGAHRVSAAILLGLKIPVVKIEEVDAEYGVDFFVSRGATENDILNYLNCYLEFKDNIRAAILWPYCKHKSSDLVHLFQGTLVYERELFLDFNGVNNLCALSYKDEPWSGGAVSAWVGMKNKSSKCFKAGKATRIILFEPKNEAHNLEIKNSIRSALDGSKHSIHSSDDYSQALDIADACLNPDSEFILNHISLKGVANIFQDFPVVGDFNFRDIVFSGSSILAVLGLRSNADIDCIHLDGVDLPPLVDSHNNYEKLFGIDIDELVFSLENSFSFMGLRFLTLSVLRNMKANRASKKDIIDIALIDDLVSNYKKKKSPLIFLKRHLLLFRYISLRSKKWFVQKLNGTRSYNFFRALYRFFMNKS